MVCKPKHPPRRRPPAVPLLAYKHPFPRGPGLPGVPQQIKQPPIRKKPNTKPQSGNSGLVGRRNRSRLHGYVPMRMAHATTPSRSRRFIAHSMPESHCSTQPRFAAPIPMKNWSGKRSGDAVTRCILATKFGISLTPEARLHGTARPRTQTCGGGIAQTPQGWKSSISTTCTGRTLPCPSRERRRNEGPGAPLEGPLSGLVGSRRRDFASRPPGHPISAVQSE